MDRGETLRLDDGRLLTCVETVRTLPNKRQVFLGDLDGCEVFAKLYLDPGRREKHWQREMDGLNAFIQSGVLTAELLYAGTLGDDKFPIILLARLQEPVSIKAAWDGADHDAREQILEDMVEVLVRHHLAGVCQTDLHLDNFVISQGEIYSLDGAGVDLVEGEVDLKSGLKNLALLMAQLSPEWDKNVGVVYDIYCGLRGETQGPGSNYLLQQVDEARERRWRKFKGKLFRDCTAFRYREYPDRLEVVSKSDVRSEMDELMSDPNPSFPGVDKALKNGVTCTVWATLVGDLPVVVKRYNSQGLLKEILQRFLPGRALTSWKNAHMLRFFGVSTPRPLAALKIRSGSGKTEAYFLTEEIKGLCLYWWLLDETKAMSDKKMMASKVVRVFAQLLAHRITHGDMKIANWFVVDDDPVLIDLDSMKRHKSDIIFQRSLRNDIRRFMKNWKDLPELSDLFRDEFKAQGLYWN